MIAVVCSLPSITGPSRIMSNRDTSVPGAIAEQQALQPFRSTVLTDDSLRSNAVSHRVVVVRGMIANG